MTEAERKRLLALEGKALTIWGGLHALQNLAWDVINKPHDTWTEKEKKDASAIFHMAEMLEEASEQLATDIDPGEVSFHKEAK